MAKIIMSSTHQLMTLWPVKLALAKIGYSEHPIFASITHSQTGQVLLHSSAAAATSSVVSLGFETNLRGYGNETLWKSLDYDGMARGY